LALAGGTIRLEITLLRVDWKLKISFFILDFTWSREEETWRVDSARQTTGQTCAGFVSQKKEKKVPYFIKQKGASSSAFFV
jgi:hypothetical protein